MADIRISGLEFHYPGSQAFGMSVSNLQVAGGERLAIVGPSGSGKTTLLSLMAGIQVPQKGEIRVGDTTVNSLNEPERRAFRIQRVGQVFQAFELLDYLTVTENVLLGSIIDPAVVTGARERAADLLASVGLSHRAHAKPARLSHGERQRVAVCRAMLNDPELLLADEPTGNLDQANKQTVVDLLIEQARQHGSTLLMVTHDNSLLGSFERVIDFEELTGAGS